MLLKLLKGLDLSQVIVICLSAKTIQNKAKPSPLEARAPQKCFL